MRFPSTLTRQAGAALLVVMTLSLGLTACKSTPSTGDDAAQNQPIQVTGPEDLLQTEDTIVAVRMNFGGELPTAMRQLSNTRDVQQLAALLADPVAYLNAESGDDYDLSALDLERPVYISLSSLGNEAFLRAAGMGLPTREEEWPTYILFRVLLPTDDPALMATQFDVLLDEFDANTTDRPVVSRSFDGPGFLRVEIAIPMDQARNDSAETQAQAWIDGLDLEDLAPPSTAAFRPTAAYNAFVNADSELALWTRFESLTGLAILEASRRSEATAIMASSPEEKAQLGDALVARAHLEAMSDLAMASVFSDPVSAEHEDISLHADANETGAILVDAVLTRTSQGARVGDASRATLALPQFDRDAFLALDWSVDLAAIAETTIAPFWKIAAEESASTSFDELGTNDAFTRAHQTSSLAMMNALAQYPMAMANAAALANAAFPVPRAGTLRGFALPQGGQLPVGLAAAMVFDNQPGTREQLQQLLSMGQMAIPMAFDAALIERDDTLIELRVALGATVAELFEGADEMEVSEPGFELDLNKLGQLRAMIPTQAGLRNVERLTFDSDDAQGHQSYRFGLNVEGDTVARNAENDAPLLTSPTFRCRTELAAAASTHLEDLSSNARTKADQYLSTFSERADRCIEPTHPYAAEAKARLDLAREWAAQLDDNATKTEVTF